MSRILTLTSPEQTAQMQRHSTQLHQSGNSVFGYFDLDGWLSPDDIRRIEYENNLLYCLASVDKVHMSLRSSESRIGELVINSAFGFCVPIIILSPEQLR